MSDAEREGAGDNVPSFLSKDLHGAPNPTVLPRGFVEISAAGEKDIRDLVAAIRKVATVRLVLRARNTARRTGCLPVLAELLLDDLNQFVDQPRVLREVVQIALVSGRRKLLIQSLSSLQTPWAPYVLAHVSTFLPGPLDMGPSGEM